MVKAARQALQTTRNGKPGRRNASGLSKIQRRRHDLLRIWRSCPRLPEKSFLTWKHANTPALSNASLRPRRRCEENALSWKIPRLPATVPNSLQPRLRWTRRNDISTHSTHAGWNFTRLPVCRLADVRGYRLNSSPSLERSASLANHLQFNSTDLLPQERSARLSDSRMATTITARPRC